MLIHIVDVIAARCRPAAHDNGAGLTDSLAKAGGGTGAGNLGRSAKDFEEHRERGVGELRPRLEG
jgi:hypothetical protein